MINKTKQSVLIKHIIRSYARLSENSKVRTILKDNLPAILHDKGFQSSLDDTSKKWLNNIFKFLHISNKVVDSSNAKSQNKTNNNNNNDNINN